MVAYLKGRLQKQADAEYTALVESPGIVEACALPCIAPETQYSQGVKPIIGFNKPNLEYPLLTQ